MHALLSGILDYWMLDVIRQSWRGFEESFDSHGDFQELLDAHD